MMRRVVDAWANDAAEFCEVLRQRHPGGDAAHLELAGGHLVTTGQGGFVNRALGIGLDVPMSPADFAVLEEHSARIGVPPSIEVTPVTHPESVAMATSSGYATSSAISALRWSATVAGMPPDDRSVGTVRVESAEGRLATWQRVAREGWGRRTAAERTASDEFAATSASMAASDLYLAVDAEDRRPVGCAQLTRRGGVATLGGMATLPNERGRGVQSALISHRVRHALESGCDVITSQTAAESASERNLMRHGFERWFTISVMTRTPG